MDIISIDPGKQSGVALFSGGKLIALWTHSKIDVINNLLGSESDYLVIIEDSRMIKTIFQDSAKDGSKAKAMKIARDVGSIDCVCEIIKSICDFKQFSMISISPKVKGKKLSHDEFCAVTGWSKQTNQHERDAAMIGWSYRMAKVDSFNV